MNEPHEPTIRKFNPGTFQPDDEVIRQFVVRHRELDTVLDVVRNNLDAPACQHVLLVAPRGRGKTMLLARVAAEVRTNAALAERLVPVRFMEESQEVFDMGDFWLEALFHLAGETAKSRPDLSRELSATHTDLAGRWAREDLEDRARAAVLDAADRLDKKLVLMVENLQTLSRDVDDDFGWKLRKTLQTEPRIMLLATATSRFAGLDDANEPFFELFRTVCLEPLDTEECRRVWQMVGGEDRGREIRPLQILTGGNPRLLVIVADFARHRSLRQLMEELVTLIDDHTEYFRGHLEGFAKTERRVYLAVIDLWRPSSTGEVARRARLDVRSVSALLKRLIDRGAVIVEGSGRKRWYAAAERLYSIYYKLRRQRDEAAVVRSLIDFMVVFYSKDELTDMFGSFPSEAAQSPAIRDGIERAMAESPQIRSMLFPSMIRYRVEQSLEQVTATVDDIEKRIVDGIAANIEDGEFREAIEAADRFFRVLGSTGSFQVPAPLIALVLINKARAHILLGEPDRATAAATEVVERFGSSDDPKIQVRAAIAQILRGYCYTLLGNDEAGNAAFEEVISRFESSDVPIIQEQVALARILTKFSGGIEEKIAAIDEFHAYLSASDAPEAQLAIAVSQIVKKLARKQPGDAEAALVACDEAVERFEGSDKLEIRILVATILIMKGTTQIDLGHAQDALHTSDELRQRFNTLPRMDGIAFGWLAMCIRSLALLVQGKHSAAMEEFRSVYAGFVSGNEAGMGMMVEDVTSFIALGASERELIEIISSDEEKAAMLAPLVVALRRRAGEDVRAPAEVLEVAEDILQRIEEKKRAFSALPPDTPDR